MRKYLIGLCLPSIIGLCVILWPRPAQAEALEMPHHEQVINDLFDQVLNSETLTQELLDTHLELYNFVMDHKDCLTCKVTALMALRQHDGNWADTLGECVDDNELDSCIVEVLFNAECQRD